MSTPAPALARDFTALPLRRRATWVVLLGAMAALGAFTVDLYLPAFPLLERELGASPSAVQLTLTGTMVGVAAGQLVVGPASDALGRRRPLLAGLSLHLLASLACAAAPTVTVLAGLRVLQGAGSASASVIALAVVRDRFTGRGAARLVARLMLVVGLSPLLAPSVGSALLPLVDWHGLFYVLAGLSGGLGLLTALLLPETHPRERRRAGGVRAAARGYGRLLHDPAVLGLVVTAGLVTAALFSYVAGSAFTFEQQYGFSAAQYGVLFAAGGLCLVAGTQTNGSLVHRLSSQTLLRTALALGTAAGGLMLAAATTGALGAAGTTAALLLVMFSLGLAMPNSAVLALERHGESAGTAAALLGACQFALASLAAPAGSLLGLAPATAMALLITSCLAAALLLAALVVVPALARPVPAASVAPVAPVAPPAEEPAAPAPEGAAARGAELQRAG